MAIKQKLILFLCALGCQVPDLIQAQATNPQAAPERISLHTPVGPNGEPQEPDAWITVHRPAYTPRENGKDAKPLPGAAVVICPGGGYGGLVMDAEGHGIASWLNQHGITGVVLQYRLPAGRSSVPLQDAQAAIRTARAHAADWNLDPKKIGIMGFSAGGHLASTAGTHFDAGSPDAKNPLERFNSRPDFQILIYPVITMGPRTHGGSQKNLLGANPDPKLVELYSNEKQVTDQTPPAFLAHALDDQAVPPDHSQAFYDAMQQHKLPCRYIRLPSGGHGLNGYKGEMWDKWQAEALTWLAELNFIPTDTAAQTKPSS